MIGTSILTAYQGHISKASLKSSTDVGWLLMSLDCMNSQLNCPRSARLL